MTVQIAGGDESIVNIVHPIFLIGNENDTAASIDVISPQFTSEDTQGPFVFGILLGTGHLETLGDGGRHRGYTTAWLAYHCHSPAGRSTHSRGEAGSTHVPFWPAPRSSQLTSGLQTSNKPTEDVVFASAVLSMELPDPGACEPVLRGLNDFASRPRVSADGRHGCIDRIVGVAATTMDPP